MTFAEVLPALLAGKRIRRASIWSDGGLRRFVQRTQLMALNGRHASSACSLFTYGKSADEPSECWVDREHWAADWDDFTRDDWEVF